MADARVYKPRNWINKRMGQLENQRNRFIPHWGQIQQYLLPFHGRGLQGRNTRTAGNADLDGTTSYNGGGRSETEDEYGGDVMTQIMDATGTKAMSVFAAGMMSGLTSPNRPWFRLTVPDSDLEDNQAVKEWLHNTEQRMYALYARSTLYDALHHCYLEMPGFGTCAMTVQEDFEQGMLFKPLTIGEYYLDNDSKGRVNTMYRRFYMTVAQLVDEFGLEQCSLAVQNMHKQGQLDAKREVVHAIEPNDDKLKGQYPVIDRFPFRSIYMEYGGGDSVQRHRGGKYKGMLRVAGFNEFPALSARWFVVGSSVYGRGPGSHVLPDVKQLQKETELKLRAIDKVIEPPVAGNGLDTVQVNTFPGGVTNAPNGNAGGQAVGPLYQINPDINQIRQDIMELQFQIKQGLFNDLFLMLAQMPDDKTMTATEVMERNQEKMQMLGPVLERLHHELLNPLIDRTFNVMMRNGMLAEVPEVLSGVDLRVEYISVLAQAQKMVGIGAIEQAMAFAGNMASVFPNIIDNLDADEAYREYVDRIGAPPSILHSKDEVTSQRQAKVQQAAAEQAMLTAEQVSNTAKTLAETEVTPGTSALNALMGA